MDATTMNTHREPVPTPGGRARLIIRRKGYRMSWVAEQLGLKPSLFSLRLSHQRNWPPDFAQQLADVLGVPVNEVTGG